ncbi:MAG: FG-GAP repeat protein [Phycisphaeraceae bacterium]|nr:FG-GAP repeat protein [Phycisphaeraceae bacterium]
MRRIRSIQDSAIRLAMCAAAGSVALALGVGSALGQVSTTRLVAPDAQADDGFGVVAISGNFALIGAPGDDDTFADSGSATVIRSNLYRVWRREMKLVASDPAAGDAFGSAVAIDNDTAVIGAPGVDDVADAAGAVYVFFRADDGSWSETIKLTAPDGMAGDAFGMAVAIDGDRLVVGAPFADSLAAAQSGAAYLFRRDQFGVWSFEAKLEPSDGLLDDEFGASVAIEGERIAVGSPLSDEGGADSGSVYVYEPDLTNKWVEVTELASDDLAPGDGLGEAVWIENGEVLAGAPTAMGATVAGAGAAYLFTADALGVWSQASKLTADDGQAMDGFGSSVGRVGYFAAVGAPGTADGGAAYYYSQDPATFQWTQAGRFNPGSLGVDDGMGLSIGFHDRVVLAGAMGDDDEASEAGAAWAFLVPEVDGTCFETERNDLMAQCDFADASVCSYISGKLGTESMIECEPDTYLILFDKYLNHINENDDSNCAGSGTASGLNDVVLFDTQAPAVFGDGGTGIVDNDDGSRSVRIGVTGRPDGLDGVFNGYFQNGPHGQLGHFRMTVTFKDANGDEVPSPMMLPEGTLVDNPQVYEDAFITGAEAFFINYRVSGDVDRVDICIDNQIQTREICDDVDWFCIEGLTPLVDYAVTQVGGLDKHCVPTDLYMGWFDKGGNVISATDTGGPLTVYPRLTFIADILGRAVIAVTGAGDADFNGTNDALEAAGPQGGQQAVDAPVCPEPPPAHGIGGCYTLCIDLYDHTAGGGGGDPPTTGGTTDPAIQTALDHGDINRDGITDTADLGILITNFGWTETTPSP